MINSIIFFLITIILLVSLHEWAHYIVARLVGVKVIRFSIGFGKVLFRHQGKHTEWCISAVPLGGYVKMVDTREGEVNEEDLPFAFDLKHPFKKILVVLAGPFMNFILAIVLFIPFFMMGFIKTDSVIGTVYPSSIAESIGLASEDKIISVASEPIASLSDFNLLIFEHLEGEAILLQVQTKTGDKKELLFNPQDFPIQVKNIILGKEFFGVNSTKLINIVGSVQAGSPAEKAGLKSGDQLVSMNKEVINTWQDFSQIIKNNPDQSLSVKVLREGKNLSLILTPKSQKDQVGKDLIGFAGISYQADELFAKKHQVKYYAKLSEAIPLSFEQTVKYSLMTMRYLERMITGKSSVKHLSGPVNIAKVAGQSAQLGLQSYLYFLAVISLGLAIMNILPVPVLDGGHFLFYLIEWIKGSPLSARIQNIALQIGVAVIITLMLIAFFNDFIRILG